MGQIHQSHTVRTGWAVSICLLLLLFATRLHNLTALPLHNDEGLHLTRAIEVWNLHPFWDISDGKIINHWLIAALYPQNAPDFAARVPTVFTAMLGMAAGFALLRCMFGGRAAVWGCLLWIGSPYLFFYERLAQSDAQAGALVVVAVWASVLLAQSGSRRWAVQVGLWLALATLMKFTAAPYALVILLVVLAFGVVPYRTRIVNLLAIGAVGLVTVSVPIGYLLLGDTPMFNIALGWLSDGSGGIGTRAVAMRYAGQWVGYGQVGWLWAVLFAGGLVALAASGRRGALRLLVFSLLPLLLIIRLSAVAFPRHFIVTVPLLLLLAGAGWGMLLGRLPGRWEPGIGTGVVIGTCALVTVPFMWAAYTTPAELRAPHLVRLEYIEAHSAGYGLREAMGDLPALAEPPVIASMFPSSCRRANFYIAREHAMICTDAPGTDAIMDAAQPGGVYVLVEESPGIGIDASEWDAELIRAYPRPGGVSVVALYYIRPFR